MPTLNLGILAHVDAGKTTLTERLLYDAGVIDTLGSVDSGSTQTDFLPLERERGITIKSAVVSFAIGETTVNLIDTPGHPDFIAEVERALAVLDGVVLVISAVEGVQPQTRVLMRALQRLRVPTILFVNKIDRRGARDDDLLAEIERRLGIDVVAMSRVEGLGTKEARAVAITSVDVRNAHPVFFGSAITGTGVNTLARGITAHLPSARDYGDELSACVFKIDRGRAGERVAYVRVLGGALRVRQRVEIADGAARKVTGIEVFRDGQSVRTDVVTAGEIAKVRGLTGVRIGDVIGVAPTRNADTQFGPPTLAATVHADDEIALRTALGQLAEQDPLINIRYDDERHELSVTLYGEVQREVIEATLALDYGIAVTFGAITTVYVERPVGVGEAVELYQEDRNPTSATMAMRVEAAAPGAGLEFVLDVDGRTVPLYIYKSTENFVASMRDYLRRALREGLRGWAVTDCRITMTQCNYYVGDGPAKPTRPTPKTSAPDFRNLTPLVVMKALERAGTVVCGPMMRVLIECPGPAAGRAGAVLARCGGSTRSRNDDTESVVIEGLLPADRVQDLRRELNVLTSGEAVVEALFAGYEPVPGPMPTRQRTTADPLNRKSYFLETMRNRPVRN